MEDRLNNSTEQDNEVLIAEMLRDAEKATVPSEEEDPVIHRGDDVLGAPMVVKEISNAGYVYVYDTHSYDKIPILSYMLAQKLRQKRPDGSYRFTATDPKKLPIRGTIKCLLHPDRPEREYYNSLGFRTCQKSNLTNDYQLKQHMRKKHPQEWAAIEEYRKEKERAEDRALQKLLLEQRSTPVETPLYVSDKPKPKKK